MSNSPLVTYINLSPNHSGKRNHAIDRITVHYVAGNCTVETIGEIFSYYSRQASSNYGVQGTNVGMYVEECNRSWCSGSGYNDNRAVTIECANLKDGSLTDSTWDTLVRLCVDICQRNGINRLVYTGDDTGNLTKHKWYDDTDCPGPWLDVRFAALARQVNERLGTYNPDVPLVNFGGTYRCNVDALNVRTKPTTNSDTVATYRRGQTVVLDDWHVSVGGYVWGRYTADSGNVRYVAIGPDTGKVEQSDYLLKVA